MAQRYGTIAAHTQRCASVLVVFVVFCVHMHSFAGLIRRTSPPTFSDTAVTDRHSDTTFFSSELTGCGFLVCWIGKIVRTCVPGGSRTLDFLRARRAPYSLGQALRLWQMLNFLDIFILMSIQNSMLCWVEHKFFIAWGPVWYIWHTHAVSHNFWPSMKICKWHHGDNISMTQRILLRL